LAKAKSLKSLRRGATVQPNNNMPEESQPTKSQENKAKAKLKSSAPSNKKLAEMEEWTVYKPT